MIFEYKNFDGKKNDVIEIVSKDSSLGLLKSSGNENIKVCLPLSLCIGKIDSLTPFNRKCLSQYYENISYDFTDDFNKLTEIVNNSKKIRVWTSHLDSNDYCLLLFICYLYQDKEISAFFSEEVDFDAITFGFVSKKEISKIEEREHILTNNQKENYSNEWKKVVNDNKELRYMLNGKVVSSNIDIFDNEIIHRLEKKGKIYICELIADLMSNPIIPRVLYSDWIYNYLINRLEVKKIIKSYIIDGKEYIEVNK